MFNGVNRLKTRAFTLRLSFLTKLSEHKNELHVGNARLYLTTKKHVRVAMEIARGDKYFPVRAKIMKITFIYNHLLTFNYLSLKRSELPPRWSPEQRVKAQQRVRKGRGRPKGALLRHQPAPPPQTLWASVLWRTLTISATLLNPSWAWEGILIQVSTWF